MTSSTMDAASITMLASVDAASTTTSSVVDTASATTCSVVDAASPWTHPRPRPRPPRTQPWQHSRPPWTQPPSRPRPPWMQSRPRLSADRRGRGASRPGPGRDLRSAIAAAAAAPPPPHVSLPGKSFALRDEAAAPPPATGSRPLRDEAGAARRGGPNSTPACAFLPAPADFRARVRTEPANPHAHPPAAPASRHDRDREPVRSGDPRRATCAVCRPPVPLSTGSGPAVGRGSRPTSGAAGRTDAHRARHLRDAPGTAVVACREREAAEEDRRLAIAG